MKRWGLFILLSFIVSSAHSAMIVQETTYILSDHPDAALTDLMNDITYGLRLDSLGGSDAERTFSTTQDGALVKLLWSGSTVTIEGKVSRNSDNSLWDVLYTLTDVTAATGAFNGFEALLSEGAMGSGTLSDGSDTFILSGQADDGVLFTALNDGHRCEAPTTSNEACTTDAIGRGWLRVGQDKDDYYKDFTKGSNDWLVQLTPVPIPAALPLLLSGLLGFTFFARKSK